MWSPGLRCKIKGGRREDSGGRMGKEYGERGKEEGPNHEQSINRIIPLSQPCGEEEKVEGPRA